MTRLKRSRGRIYPYAAAEILLFRCVRCDRPGFFQWQVCADFLFKPLCTECDIALNDLVLAFLGDSKRHEKIRQYRTTVEQAVAALASTP